MTTANPELKLTDVVSALQWRRSTKKFDSSRKIEQALWSKLEEALVLSPSSFGLQPWKFVVITDAGVKAKLLPYSRNQAQVVDCSHLVVLCRQQSMTPQYVETYLQSISQARSVPREALQGYADMMLGTIKSRSQADLEDWMSRQVYIALGVLMTVASAYGIDNCPMEGLDTAAYDRELQLAQKGLSSVVMCALGYRADDDQYCNMKKVRFPLEDLVMRI